MRSKFLSWNGWDWLKGLVVAVLTAVLTYLQIVLVDPSVYSFKAVMIKCGWTALAAFVAYLLKNLFTNSKGEILKTE